MQIYGIKLDITLYSTEKESHKSDVRLRRNRRPKFLLYNSFSKLTGILAVLRSVALFDSKLHILDDLKCNYLQKMNARAQRARQNKKRINSFGLTSQREFTLQEQISSKLLTTDCKLQQDAYYDSDYLYQDGLKSICSQKMN